MADRTAVRPSIHRGAARGRPAATLVRAPGPKPGTKAFFDQVDREMLAATLWLDPAASRISGPVVIRFTGHRKGVGAKTRPGDQFVQDERVDDVRPDSGPISVTTRVRGITAGEWLVTSKVLSPDPGARSARMFPAEVRTAFEPFAHVPGMVPLAWGATAFVGFVVALATQQALLARIGAPMAGTLAVSLVAIAAGLVGSQVRFWLDHRREGRFLGWAVQGFLTATTVVGIAALAVAGIPAGAFVDATAPGLFFGLAIGRIGCFFGGCCYGRPTSSRWGIWSSDQRIGRRRIPTQLVESACSLGIAMVALAAILGGAPLRGGVFVAALASYTFVRQGILHMRGERAAFGLGGKATAALALVVLIADLVYLGASWGG